MGTRQKDKAMIVLVDDAVDNISFLFDTLAADYSLLSATSGADALIIARQEKPALLLINRFLPDMDGEQLCQRLRAEKVTADTPIILLTNNAAPEFETAAIASGANDVLSFPQHPDMIRQRVSTQIELKCCRDEHEQFHGLDPVTGLANRERFETELASEWQRGKRSAQNLALLLLEIDDFTAYQDHYGHPAGNACLKQTAKLIGESLQRSADRLTRYSDYQFACILPDTDRDGALLLAEKLRHGIDSQRLDHPQSSVADHLTLSVGVASIIPAEGTHSADLVIAARRYLNEAKRYGGNRAMGSLKPVLSPSEEP